MSNLRQSQNEINIQNERLARAFYANGRYTPYFLGAIGIGFFAIYMLTRFGILGQSSPQLIYIGTMAALLALVQLPLLALARRNQGISANLWGSAAVGTSAILLTYFWQGIIPVSILVALIVPVIALRTGVPRRYLPVLLLIVIVSIAGIFYAEKNSAVDRLQNSSPAAVASFAFLVAIGLLLVTITIISENKNFKSLQTLLLTSFIVIVTIPTIMAAVLSAIVAFTNSQTQTFNTLKAISNLKQNQISTLIKDFQNDTEKLQNDSAFRLNALNVLTAKEIDPLLMENSKRLVRLRVDNVIGSEEEQYNEVLILNTQGDVIVSTLPQSEGMNFEDQLFFRQGTLGFYTGFTGIASFGNENLIVATPIFDSDGRVIRGILAFRSNAGSIKEIMENTPGYEDAETYLVDKNYKPVTKTRAPADVISTQASLEAILNNITNGQDVYENYNNQTVLGYYEWFEDMQVAVIAEIPLNFVVANLARALAGSAVLAVFVIFIAIASVAISARSIVHPITVLAETTENFAAGKLSARAPVDRADEIGALARSYNQMAGQLQEIIGRLEQRVNDRTRDLEDQTLRLRVAAEIARDSASARELGELLDRSTKLILNRFNFYHTGIFLLDNSKEYAVLVASPTEAGKQMLTNNHRLRVGEVGIVGRVAATGEPRITLDTGSDATHFNNPLLPNTRSEMALPLKAENNVIGVLDIQSDQPQAFNEDDITIMQTMADQLATAIERTRLLQELEKSLKELETSYGQYTRENWKRSAYSTQAGSKGYRFDNIRIESITELPELGKNVLETGATVSSSNQSVDKLTTVAIPVKLRGQTIGVISLKLKEDYGEDTISTIELAGERLASALESARLYEEARLRADREQSISQVTTAISATANYEDILQTTVRELGTTLKDTEVTIQIIGDLKDGKQAG